MEKKLRRRLWGFKKKDVLNYIDTLVSDYEKSIEEYKEDAENFKKQNQTLISENAELFKKVSDLESEREYISKAVISAELRAKKVLEDANAEAEALREKKEAELNATNEEILSLKTQIRTLKLAAVATLRKYEAQFDEITGEEVE